MNFSSYEFFINNFICEKQILNVGQVQMLKTLMKAFFFEAIISVNLTVMLVLTTM